MLDYRIRKGQFICNAKKMEKKNFEKYININERQNGNTPSDLVETIRWDFYSTHSQDVEQEDLDRIWSFIEPRLVKNAGLAHFTIDYDGAKSDYFFPWLMTVQKSPAAALEMAYGSGYNLAGEWVEHVPKSDGIYLFMNDPTFWVHRDKMDYIANLAINVRNTVPEGTKTKVIDLGAGRVMWAMRHRDILEPERQTILAFDKDKSIMPSTFEPEKTGIIFKNADFADELWRPGCRDANLIILSGVASYYPLDILRARILHPVYNLLQHGGAFFFDWQLECLYYQRSMSIFSWPKIKLERDFDAAHDAIDGIRKAMWRQGMKFDMDCRQDTYGKDATVIMITLTKL